MIVLEWRAQSHRIESVDELDSILDRIAQASDGMLPVLIELVRPPGGESLKIGLGGPRSVLEYMSGSQEPPYFVSIGQREESGCEIYLFDGEQTEIPRKHLIAVEDARRAARVFFTTGELPKDVQWESI